MQSVGFPMQRHIFFKLIEELNNSLITAVVFVPSLFLIVQHQSEHLLKQVIMKITLCSTFFNNSVTRYKICFPLFEIIILNITSLGDYFDLSNHLHR